MWSLTLGSATAAFSLTPDSLIDCAQARWARGGEDGFAARVATKAAELRASRAYVPDGLSVEEYAETKLREKRRASQISRRLRLLATHWLICT